MRVFISYSSRDRPAALRLKEIVESEGHDVWMDLFDIRPAERLAGELEQGVASADLLCILLSPTAVASPWVRNEVRHALAAEAKGLRILPIILRTTPIPDELSDRVALDATRGLDDDAVVMRLWRALGGSVEEGVLLDAVRRGELADRAAVDAAEDELPARREALERVLDDPIRRLSVSVDQDTWPDGTGSVIEIGLAIDIFQGRLTILLAPYVEGHTWRPDAGLDERPPRDFFAATKPRVDARLLWAGRVLTAADVRDGTDLGELPLQFTFELPGDEYTGEERARTMALLTTFELPSLRELIDRGSTVEVWRHPPEGAAEAVDPATTDLRLRVEAPLRKDEAGIYGFRLWSDHDRLDTVLLRAPTLQACSTDLEREALLSIYRDVPLRAEAGSAERRERIEAALAAGEPPDEADRWPAFNLVAGRADVPRLRGQVREAVERVHEAVGLVVDLDPADFDYPTAFRLLGALTQLVADLERASATPGAIAHYSGAVVDLGRRLSELHPEEADYRRALAKNLLQRARLYPRTPGAEADVREAVEIGDGLVGEEPLPWRVEEARALREDAATLLAEWGAPALAESAAPTDGAGEAAPSIDPAAER